MQVLLGYLGVALCVSALVFAGVLYRDRRGKKADRINASSIPRHATPNRDNLVWDSPITFAMLAKWSHPQRKEFVRQNTRSLLGISYSVWVRGCITSLPGAYAPADAERLTHYGECMVALSHDLRQIIMYEKLETGRYSMTYLQSESSDSLERVYQAVCDALFEQWQRQRSVTRRNVN